MSSALIHAPRDDLAGSATARGTPRFTPEQPLPNAIVKRIGRERMAQIDGD